MAIREAAVAQIGRIIAEMRGADESESGRAVSEAVQRLGSLLESEAREIEASALAGHGDGGEV